MKILAIFLALVSVAYCAVISVEVGLGNFVVDVPFEDEQGKPNTNTDNKYYFCTFSKVLLCYSFTTVR